MRAESKFLNQPMDFWANIKLISQKIGYIQRKTSQIKVPTIQEIQHVFSELRLDTSKVLKRNAATPFGLLLIEYFQHRADFLTGC